MRSGSIGLEDAVECIRAKADLALSDLTLFIRANIRSENFKDVSKKYSHIDGAEKSYNKGGMDRRLLPPR